MISVPYVPETDQPAAPRPPRRSRWRRCGAATLIFLVGLTGTLLFFHVVG